jgi:hypothetical protein
MRATDAALEPKRAVSRRRAEEVANVGSSDLWAADPKAPKPPRDHRDASGSWQLDRGLRPKTPSFDKLRMRFSNEPTYHWTSP